MATYRATIETSLSRAETFAYLHDFTNAEEWDPGVVAAEHLSRGPIGVGSEFSLSVRAFGRTTDYRYSVVEHVPDERVVFRAETSLFESEDTLRFEATESGTRVVYEAVLRPRGVARLLSPLLARGFERIARRGEEGLATTLDARAAAARG